MKTRIISILLYLPILLFFVIKGGNLLLLFTLVLSLIALYEYKKALESKQYTIHTVLLYVISTLFYILLYKGLAVSDAIVITVTLLFFVNVIFVLAGRSTVMEMMFTLGGYLYIPVFFSFVSSIERNFGLYIWLIFVIAFATDTFAYLVGKAIGKRHFIPHISPNKTIAGSVGGIIACLICVYLFERFLMGNPLLGNMEMFIRTLLIGLIGSIFGQAGDLFASAIKRTMEVKDFGNLMPGHGGILDRFDSILFIAPFMYYVLLYTV